MADYTRDLYDYQRECQRNCSAFDDGYQKGKADAINFAIENIFDTLKYHHISYDSEENSFYQTCHDGSDREISIKVIIQEMKKITD